MHAGKVMGLGLALVLAVALTSRAADDDEKKLEGKVCCAKCELKVKGQTKCATVIVVKEKDKDVTYWFDPAGDKKFHGKICTEPMDGTVTGTVKKDGEKMIVTVKDVKFK